MADRRILAAALHAAAGFAVVAAFYCTRHAADVAGYRLALVAVLLIVVDLIATGARLVRTPGYGWRFVLFALAGAAASAWLFRP